MKTKKGKERPRFFYLVPSIRPKRLGTETRWQYLKRLLLWGNSQIPIGGVKIIHQHCDILNRNGYEAYPVHLCDSKINWFPYKTSTIRDKDALSLVRESDILICPEIIPLAAEPFTCKRKIAFIQNWYTAQRATGPDKCYEDFRFTDLLVCSHYIKDYMKSRSTLPCSVVVNGIDLDVFRPLPNHKIPRRVLYLNRKNVNDAREAIKILESEILKVTRFVGLESRYNQDQIARHYQEADIFMAIGYPEGFALPPLEAMACGCAVIGFTGGGGTEHMIDGRTALIAPDGDTEVLAHCLKRVLTDDTLKEKIRTGGLNKARQFSIERMERELLAFAAKFH